MTASDFKRFIEIGVKFAKCNQISTIVKIENGKYGLTPTNHSAVLYMYSDMKLNGIYDIMDIYKAVRTGTSLIEETEEGLVIKREDGQMIVVKKLDATMPSIPNMDIKIDMYSGVEARALKSIFSSMEYSSVRFVNDNTMYPRLFLAFSDRDSVDVGMSKITAEILHVSSMHEKTATVSSHRVKAFKDILDILYPDDMLEIFTRSNGPMEIALNISHASMIPVLKDGEGFGLRYIIPITQHV